MNHKKIPILGPIVAIICFSILFLSCEEDIPELSELTVPDAVSLDADAGDWAYVLESDYLNDLSLAGPATVDSDAYQGELEELAAATARRTADQEIKVRYWGAGGVLRWNRILRDLVAKYNIAPPPGVVQDPKKPVANPPFAARAYAMLSVAQHDALIATWKLKYTVNRPAPSIIDDRINTVFPTTDLPSYPSENAVIASTSLTVLKSLFPLESDFLDALAEEQVNTVRWGGTGTQSDIADGWSLGTFVASKILERARTDRMDAAGDLQETYKAFFDINPSTIPVAWVSLANPEVFPILPMYGRVKTWHDSTAVFSHLPPPPPDVGSEAFEADIAYVKSISLDRSREQWRISSFWEDGGGTYTPPGHWNAIAEDLLVDAQWSEVRTARAFSIMNRAVMDSGILCWFAKYKYYFPRPSQIDPEIKTSAGIPNFPSYTSGHSSFSSTAGTVLGYLFPDQREEMQRQYIEAGDSRVYGGIHYEFDNVEGRVSGVAIGELAISLARQDGADE
ncbi:phosphatase PAP2 family protein [Flagellimonas sp.]|uniref:phosphatase PAP2 family protein n=1 Tax=Flagellimonas sp. TaxID=2058762 RepID=UPI003BB00413